MSNNGHNSPDTSEVLDPPEGQQVLPSYTRPAVWTRFIFNPAAPVPPDQPIYDGLLSKGDLAVWLGREKHRKSSVLLQFAICAALGRKFLHFPFRSDKPLKVVILDYESKSQTIKQRYDAIVNAMHLSNAEQTQLKAQLQIVEMRKAFRRGVKLPRFPVKPERGEAEADAFAAAENSWRSLIRHMDADLYIIDPLRCMHAQAENDSTIEALLTRIHQFFGDSAVIVSHHLRKRNRKASDQVVLKDDMRTWADEARGSGAITAHSDVIVCQEREVESGMERLQLGAYLRDGADIEPLVLRETEPTSFLWQIAADVSIELDLCLDELKKAGGSFASRTAAVGVLKESLGTGRSTAFSRLNELLHRRLVVEREGTLQVNESLDYQVNP